VTKEEAIVCPTGRNADPVPGTQPEPEVRASGSSVVSARAPGLRRGCPHPAAAQLPGTSATYAFAARRQRRRVRQTARYVRRTVSRQAAADVGTCARAARAPAIGRAGSALHSPEVCKPANAAVARKCARLRPAGIARQVGRQARQAGVAQHASRLGLRAGELTS